MKMLLLLSLLVISTSWGWANLPHGEPIYGTITDATTGLPMVGVKVEAFDDRENLLSTTETKAGGAFELKGNLSKASFVTLSKEGFHLIYHEVKPGTQNTLVIFPLESESLQGSTYPKPAFEDSATVDKMPRELNRIHFLMSLQYPSAAKEKGIQGVILLDVLVSKHGEVLESNLVETPGKVLSDEVMSQIHLLKFSPALKAGMPTAVWTRTFVRYKLN